jgi:hypothetical protein
MEFGFLFEHTDKDNETYSNPTTLIKYGLNDHFEIGLITEFVTIKSDPAISGLSPMTLRFKEKITDEKGILPVTTFIGYLTIPHLASKELQITYYAPAFKFAMQNTLTKDLSIGYNFGAEWDGETPEPEFLYSFSAGYSITEKLSAFAEVYGFMKQLSKSEHSLDGGFNYLYLPNLLFDISAGIGLTDNAPEYFLGLGCSLMLKN